MSAKWSPENYLGSECTEHFASPYWALLYTPTCMPPPSLWLNGRARQAIRANQAYAFTFG